MKSLDLISIPHHFETRKNFLSNTLRADLSFGSQVKNPAHFVNNWFIPTLKDLLSTPLINIKGESGSERLFLISGVAKPEDPESEMPGEEFSLEVKTTYAGRHSKGKYLNKITIRSTDGLTSGTTINFEKLQQFVSQSFEINRCELHLEFLTEHFFSKLGLAPVVEESIAITLDGETKKLNVVVHSDSLINTANGPLNNKDWGQKLSQLSGLLADA